MTIINKTDHVIALWVDDSWTTIMPSGLCTKLKEQHSVIDTKHGVTFKKHTILDIISLPDIQIGRAHV